MEQQAQKSEQKKDGLWYVGDLDTISFYKLWFDGRPIFGVLVDNADPELRIQVKRLDPESKPLVTSGIAKIGLHSVKSGPDEGDVNVLEHIVSDTIRSYVYPRLTRILANLYVPKIDS